MRRLPPITYLIIIYMLLAFGWWSVLLVRKNAEAFEARTEVFAIKQALERRIDAPADFRHTVTYAEMRGAYVRQRNMIIGEALLLVLSLGGGLYLLYRNLRREISAAEQQRNFLLSITHELKSPLAGIRLVLETFQRRTGLQPEIQAKLSSNGLTETDRLTTLVNDLLLSAKLETSYQLNAEPLDLGEILQDAVERVAGKYRNASIHLDIEPGLPRVNGDRLGMTSVALNLLENAVKYSQPKPRIETTLQRGGAGELTWTVADNGMGIPDAEKRKVWTKFYRVGSEDTRTTKGTGLGLFIVRTLIERHGGQIELTDNEPRGTKFSIYLPTTKRSA